MADFKMPEINNVILAGNLTREPVYRTTHNGSAVVHFTIAANRRYRGKNDELKELVSYVGITARNKLADSCNSRLTKGSAVLVEGQLQNRSWETDDGKTQRSVEISARRIQFLHKPDRNREETESSRDEVHDTNPELDISGDATSPISEQQSPISTNDENNDGFNPDEVPDHGRSDSSNSYI